MNPLITFVLLLLFLFLLSSAVMQNIGSLLYGLLRSRRLTVGVLAFIFLPGTTVHEFAHAAAAQLTGVGVGDIKLLPEVEGKSIKFGSVQVAECDPFRNFLIGVAPLIVGFAVILLVISIYGRFEVGGFWQQALLFYLLFEIGNTMFSSSRDLKGVAELVVAVGLICVLLYLVGFRDIFANVLSLGYRFGSFFHSTSALLVKIIILDLVVIGSAKILSSPLSFGINLRK